MRAVSHNGRDDGARAVGVVGVVGVVAVALAEAVGVGVTDFVVAGVADCVVEIDGFVVGADVVVGDGTPTVVPFVVSVVLAIVVAPMRSAVVI